MAVLSDASGVNYEIGLTNPSKVLGVFRAQMLHKSPEGEELTERGRWDRWFSHVQLLHIILITNMKKKGEREAGHNGQPKDYPNTPSLLHFLYPILSSPNWRRPVCISTSVDEAPKEPNSVHHMMFLIRSNHIFLGMVYSWCL